MCIRDRYISWFLYGIALTVLFVIFMFSGILSINDMDYANDQPSPLAVLLGIFLSLIHI